MTIWLVMKESNHPAQSRKAVGGVAQDHYKPRNPYTFNKGQIQHFLTLHGLFFVAFFRRERERERRFNRSEPRVEPKTRLDRLMSGPRVILVAWWVELRERNLEQLHGLNWEKVKPRAIENKERKRLWNKLTNVLLWYQVKESKHPTQRLKAISGVTQDHYKPLWKVEICTQPTRDKCSILYQLQIHFKFG